MDYFALQSQDLAQGLALKDSNRSWDWVGYLYNAMKLQSVSPNISSNLTHSFK